MRQSGRRPVPPRPPRGWDLTPAERAALAAAAYPRADRTAERAKLVLLGVGVALATGPALLIVAALWLAFLACMFVALVFLIADHFTRGAAKRIRRIAERLRVRGL